MKKIALFLTYFLTLLLGLMSFSAHAGTLTAVSVKNEAKNTKIEFSFSLQTKYSYFALQNPERLVIDFANSQSHANLLPKKVADSVVTNIRTSNPPRSTTLRVVLELSQKSAVKFQNNGKKIVVTVDNPTAKPPPSSDKKTAAAKITNSAIKTATTDKNRATAARSNTARTGVLVIAIDAGHGGKDPGAIGTSLGLREKNVTLQIAKELKALLDKDPRFKSVLTRTGDYFISVPNRSEIARKNKANYLISIHADSNGSSSLRGASVWVLSNKRASSEMGRWLEDHEKQSELLGGAGNVLASHDEKYLNQTVLDLQFGHSQRAGYQLGQSILKRFGSFAKLSKNVPQHASLGVLRSPDIPSVLVETGFLSNHEEESKLATAAYRRQIANAIYRGLIDYYNTSGEAVSTKSSATAKSTNKSAVNDNTPQYHTVKKNETLGAISIKYNIKLRELRRLNNLSNDNVRVGQKIKLRD
ncbi:N-acetylmuramoyl-L-alanine amidase [Pasteurella testudinis DSM 23072]|uniref:N-acetylmuramoyl-L-alanine amidase n=1 Tax=Pasteurella testudinis DSM 23072 TaxID=1122938 RepID=A0A1W1UB91_9PAST|nr:N-acetylmuramoyl-L-alanine amidase [Pasteurella testudinis DSM 23072]SUB52622.1 N-acetylmuramoyl-L-alanine amidase AmiB [Pasteurella testudinis]